MMDNTTGLEFKEYNITWPDMEFSGTVKVVRLHKRTERWFNGPEVETDLVTFSIDFPNEDDFRLTLPIEEFKSYII